MLLYSSLQQTITVMQQNDSDCNLMDIREMDEL